jgi:hypothetical protein
MDSGMIAEALRLMSSMSQSDIKDALSKAFQSPAPPISARTVSAGLEVWNSPGVRMQCLLMRLEMELPVPSMRQLEHCRTYDDGTQAFKVHYVFPKKMGNPVPRPKVDAERLWKNLRYLNKASQRADAFLSATDELHVANDAVKRIETLLKAAEKCGIPRTKADLLAANGKIETALRAALLRRAVKMATLNGAWMSAGLTAVFDFGLLLDGQLKQYLANIGVSGLYGGALGGLSSWVNHPFFGNGIVLGVIVGSMFGAVSLASTGDWARFGKSLGVNILGGAAAWGGGAAGGALLGAWFGPIGTAVGAILGACGAGFLGRKAAVKVPGLGGATDYEIQTMYKAITEQLAAAGLVPDPGVSPREVVEATIMHGAHGDRALPFNVRMVGSMAAGVSDMHEILVDIQRTSPEVFARFHAILCARGRAM